MMPLRVAVRLAVKLSVALAAISPPLPPATAEQERPNVLLIISDDLRAELGCYGVERAKTPHLDEFAKSGVLFERAYCQFPLCNPSRSSMLTGRHPGTTGVLGNRDWFRSARPELTSLPQHFKNHGYATLRAGKIFHGGIDDEIAWTEGAEARYFGPNLSEAAVARGRERENPRGGLSKSQRSDRRLVIPGNGEKHGDYRSTDRAIEYLTRYANKEQPFFVALGLSKPHTPLEAPQWAYDLYQQEQIELPGDFAARPAVPPGFPKGSVRRENADLFMGREATPEEAREMTRAYLASVSYVDSNVGRILDALKRLELDDDTIVVFWADHGFQLGEKGKWSKAGSLWEPTARVPLIIRRPEAGGNGSRVRSIVQAIDIYPTLAELCGLPIPETVQGRTLTPLLEHPSAVDDEPAYTVWSADGRTLSGIVVRKGDWRYGEFADGGPLLTNAVTDPHELTNLAGNPEYAANETELRKLIQDYRTKFGPGANVQSAN